MRTILQTTAPYLLALIVLVFVAGCSTSAPFQVFTPEALPGVERPLDPWVTRSDLDGRAQMVTIALSDSLWVAYDAATCDLYKVWKGGVKFEGTPYWTGGEQSAWALTEHGETRNVMPQFRGYRFEQGRVILQYELPLPGEGMVSVDELPEYVTGPDGQPGLVRLIQPRDVPPGVQVSLRIEGTAFSPTHQQHTDGIWEQGRSGRYIHDWGPAYASTGRLRLRSNGYTTLTQYYAPNPSNGVAGTSSDVEGEKRLMKESATKVGGNTPGRGGGNAKVHPSFDLMTVSPSTFQAKVSGMDFLPDGRMIVSVWDGEGGVYILEGGQGDKAEALPAKKIAGGLAKPLGLEVKDGNVFVTQKQELTQLIDHNGGEIIDEYRSLELGPDHSKRMEEDASVTWLPHRHAKSVFAHMKDGPYTGQMIYGTGTQGGLNRVFVETVDGLDQGAVFPFIQGFDTGVNQMMWGPDGALYLPGKKGVQRLTYNEDPAFEMLAVRAKTNGLEVEFTEPLAEDMGADPGKYLVELRKQESTKKSIEPRMGLAQRPVKTASVSEDRKRVFLETPGLKENHVVHLHLAHPPGSASGRPLWSTDAWYTLNRIPAEAYGVVDTTQVPAHNTLTPEEEAEGWELLFDGTSLSKWRGFRQTDIPAGWVVTDQGELHFTGEESGDLITNRQYANFELKLEWKVAPGGNSGLFFRGTENEERIYETAPEMQILDNQRHKDGGNPLTSAGSNYALHAPPEDVTREVGQFNEVHLIVSGPYVEHWLNGEKVVAYTLWSDAWNALVAGSKFSDWTGYGQNRRGHIGLQDHGDKVWFRNLKIRRL